MNMLCREEPEVLAPATLLSIQNHLRKVFESLPDVILCVIVNPAGEVLLHDSNGVNIPLHPLVSNISLMKRALLEFGDCVGSAPCPAVHVKGDTQAISCYSIGIHVLGVVCRSHPTSLEWYSPSFAEQKLAPTLQALTRALKDPDSIPSSASTPLADC